MIPRRLGLLLLPLALLLLSGGLLGCFLETNDDLAIVALLRGETAAAPVANLHLYFHGYAAAWSWLYQAAPMVPWYGITLYALLYAATVLVAAVLARQLRPVLGPWGVLGVGLLLWGVLWLEHSLWFSYVRVPVLLAGAGVLFAAQRAPARGALAVGLLAFALAWLIRPSAAVLGLLAAAPGVWWLAGRRGAVVLGAAAVLAVAGALGLNLSWSPQAATFRRLDVRKSNLNDFQLTAPPTPPLRAPDSLALAAARRWMLADSTLTSEAFFTRAAPVQPRYFLQHTAPAKLAALLRQLPRNYFPALLLVLASCGLVARQPGRHPAFWLAQLGYAAAVLGLGTVLKLPPRLALPLFDFWVLSNLLFVMQPARRPPAWAARGLLLVLAVAAVPYAYKTWHRSQRLTQEQQQNQGARQRLQRLAAAPGRVALVVTDAWEETYKSESPFADGPTPAVATYTMLPPQPKRLMVAGWLTLHPSQAVFRQQCTGTRSFPESLCRLARRPGVVWLLTPAGAGILNQQLARVAGARVQLQPARPLSPADSSVAQVFLPHEEKRKAPR